MSAALVMLRETGRSATCNIDRSTRFAHYGKTIAAIRRTESRKYLPEPSVAALGAHSARALQDFDTQQPKACSALALRATGGATPRRQLL